MLILLVIIRFWNSFLALEGWKIFRGSILFLVTTVFHIYIPHINNKSSNKIGSPVLEGVFTFFFATLHFRNLSFLCFFATSDYMLFSNIYPNMPFATSIHRFLQHVIYFSVSRNICEKVGVKKVVMLPLDSHQLFVVWFFGELVVSGCYLLIN